MSVRLVLALILLAALPLAAGDNKSKGVPMVKLAGQKAEIANLDIADPAQKCTDYAVAVALATMLKMQDVDLDQHFWVQKANGGELCIDSLPEIEDFTRTVNGRYTLTDGRKITLQTKAIAGGQAIPDAFLAPLKHGKPILVFWNGRAFLLQGAVYDEYIYPNNQRMYITRELRLVDPLAAKKDREVSFVNGTDDPAGISAFIFVSATVNPPPKWQTDTKWQH